MKWVASLATVAVAASGFAQIVNGDFEAGNTGFTSGYLYNATSWTPAGVYGVDTDPHLHHSSWASFGDHTSGFGKMMIVNGSGAPNTTVWAQTVSVTANTTYKFNIWIASTFSASPAQLQLSVNGTNTSGVFIASSTTGLWQQFTSTWNSGASTSANLRIINQNTIYSGNDFAMDDLEFGTVPEPSSLLALGGLAMMVGIRTRRKKG